MSLAESPGVSSLQSHKHEAAVFLLILTRSTPSTGLTVASAE